MGMSNFLHLCHQMLRYTLSAILYDFTHSLQSQLQLPDVLVVWYPVKGSKTDLQLCWSSCLPGSQPWNFLLVSLFFPPHVVWAKTCCFLLPSSPNTPLQKPLVISLFIIASFPVSLLLSFFLINLATEVPLFFFCSKHVPVLTESLHWHLVSYGINSSSLSRP